MGMEMHETELQLVESLGSMALASGPMLLEDMRRRLHDLGNCLTGLVGNLELVEMSMGDPELDLVSLEAALDAGRTSLRQLRELRAHLDGKI
jgi:hypothetical protein